jgi:hypothetical protein
MSTKPRIEGAARQVVISSGIQIRSLPLSPSCSLPTTRIAL